MKIAVLGTGMVGQALAARLSGLGHTVTVGTRDPEATLARTEAPTSARGSASTPRSPSPRTPRRPPVPSWSCWRATARASHDMLAAAGGDHLDGTVVLDISNPLDFSAGFPPSLFVKDTDSLGEQLQRRFPGLRIVKSLNTLNASLMVEPAALGTSSTVFVSGDDAEAKALVVSLLESFGHDDVIDLGGIETARGAEMVLPLWLRLMGALGTPHFNLKVVR